MHISPRLGDAFFEQLKNAGLTLEELYRRHAEFFELHDIAEELVDYDEHMQLFRYAHLKLAQRIIGGGVVGTMGTPVEVLKQRMEYPLYRAALGRTQRDHLTRQCRAMPRARRMTVLRVYTEKTNISVDSVANFSGAEDLTR